MMSDKETERFAKKFVGIVTQSLINEGVIDPNGKTGIQILKEVEDYVLTLKDEDWVFVIDHTADLLTQARLYKKEENKERACLFYALYIEHKLNSFMATLAKRKNLSAKDIESLEAVS